MTRKECLDKAAGCVLQDRASKYGGVEDNFARIARFWGVYLGVKMEAHDVACLMALLKIARARINPGHDDSWIDLAGYAACGAECAGAAKAREDAVRRAGAEYRRLREQEQEPEFKPGDAVEALSFDGKRWEEAVVERTEILSGKRHCTVRLASGERHCLPAESVRRPPVAREGGFQLQSHWRDFVKAKKAEGCEELVVSPFDAPQGKEELYSKILESNPATFGHPHAPTGEELAEMTQEDAHG